MKQWQTNLLSFLILSSNFLLQGMGTYYHSAGILPYAIDGNRVLLLVGLEPFRNNQAFDFGGKADPEDNNNPRYTAAREGAEEMLFLFDQNSQEFERILTLYKTHGKKFELHKANARTYKYFTETLKSSPTVISRDYITFFAKVDYNPALSKLFADRHNTFGSRLPSSWREKNRLVWLELNEVVKALSKNPDDNNLWVNSNQGMIKIFPHFAGSLRTAWKNGVFNQLR